MTTQEFLTIALPAIIGFFATWAFIIWFLVKMNKKKNTTPNAYFANKLQNVIKYAQKNPSCYVEIQKQLKDYLEDCESNHICPVCSMPHNDKYPNCGARTMFKIEEGGPCTDYIYQLKYDPKDDNTPHKEQNAQNAKTLDALLEKYRPCQREFHDSLMDDIRGFFK